MYRIYIYIHLSIFILDTHTKKNSGIDTVHESNTSMDPKYHPSTTVYSIQSEL